MNKEEQIKNLKFYLSPYFYVLNQITKQDLQNYKKSYPEVKNLYIYESEKELKKIGCYLCLVRGNERYKVYNAYDIFNTYIGRDEDKKDWLDLTTPLIFLYYPAFTESNKKTLELLGHIVSHRRVKNFITIILTEVPLPYVKDVILNNKIEALNIEQVSLNSSGPVKVRKPKNLSNDPFM